MRKYLTEFALNMFCTHKTLLQQQDFDYLEHQPEIDNHSYHIYIIGRRPKIIFNPKEFHFSQDIVHGSFDVINETNNRTFVFDVPNLLGSFPVSMECNYPYTEFKIIDKHGNIISNGKTALFLTQIASKAIPILDLEVLYIGQAYGENGNRIATDRLKNHSTLQSIYAESITKSPNMDIWIILLEFTQNNIISIDGRKQKYQTSNIEDNAHIKQCLSENISEKQKINFTEAALIKYFQPEYNKIYKNIFPNPMHNSYSERYDLEINHIAAEIQTDEIKTRLFSKKIKPKVFHIAQFDLYSQEDRKGMFDFN